MSKLIKPIKLTRAHCNHLQCKWMTWEVNTEHQMYLEVKERDLRSRELVMNADVKRFVAMQMVNQVTKIVRTVAE